MSTTYGRPKPCGATAENISAYAEKIAKALDFKPGSELEPVITRLGGEIEYLPFVEIDSRKASITVNAVNEGGSFVIRLPSFLFPLQKRMLIAHELGHLFLHSRFGELALEAYHNAEGENEIVEDEAHEFACAFLMPTELLCRVAKIYKNDSIGVAVYFMVPEPVVRQRMIDIGVY